jgi:predicted RNA-binding protein with PUA domain
MIIEVNKKRTTVSPVAEGNEEDRFAVHDTMVIDMEKLIAQGDNAITINADGKSTGVTVGTISDGIALSDWKEGTTVKVTLVYVPTGELLMTMKRTI